MIDNLVTDLVPPVLTMPIIIKDYLWRQTEINIIIHVSIRGVPPSKVDIFTLPRYVKASFEQKFFEVILLHPVDVPKSKCTVNQNEILFELKKESEGIWESLEPNVSKAEKLALKKQFLDDGYLYLQNENVHKINKKAELKRIAVREQIELDTKNREIIEHIKKDEETKALGDINEWTATSSPKTPKLNKTCITKKNKIVSLPTKVTESVPVPRITKTLQIDFTPREFPTPSRESKLEEENEWLKKQAEARRSAGFISEDIRPEERNPQFLKFKGDEFFKNKNYLGAISAYSFGIKLSSNFVDLYIARSQVHLILGNFNKVIQDCSTALDLLKPEVPVNLKERALCIGRRGQALCKIGLTKQGIEEIKISLKLVPDDYFQTVLDETDKNE